MSRSRRSSKAASAASRKRKRSTNHTSAKKAKLEEVEPDHQPEEICENNVPIKSKANFHFDISALSVEFIKDSFDPLLRDLEDQRLCQWMLLFNLFKRPKKCTKADCGSTIISWSETPRDFLKEKVWQCSECKQSISIRHGSFFSNLKCDIKVALLGIRAFCDQISVNSFVKKHGIKEQVVRRIFQNCAETMEAYFFGRSPGHSVALGGEGSVVLLDMWPNGYLPAPEIANEKKRSYAERVRVLWLADTLHVPVRYWVYLLPPMKTNAELRIPKPTGKEQREGNRKKKRKKKKEHPDEEPQVDIKKLEDQQRQADMVNAVFEVAESRIAPGSLVLANDQALPTLCEKLRASGQFEAVMSTVDLLAVDSQGHRPTPSILHNIWNRAGEMCSEIQSATRPTASRRVVEFLWRQEYEGTSSETFYNMLTHIASHYDPSLSSNSSSNIEPEH